MGGPFGYRKKACDGLGEIAISKLYRTLQLMCEGLRHPSADTHTNPFKGNRDEENQTRKINDYQGTVVHTVFCLYYNGESEG